MKPALALATVLAIVVLIIMFIPEAAADRDYYQVLGIDRSASERDIKKAYRKLSLKYHPDKNPNDKEAEKNFVEVTRAYEVLNSPDTRKVYDQHGEAGLKQQQQNGGMHFHDPFDIFSQFGGGGFGNMFGFQQQGQQQERVGPDVHLEFRCTLEDLYNGEVISVLTDKQSMCPECMGTGANQPDDLVTCSQCKGSGQVVTRQQIAPGFVQQMQTPCNKCGGKGKTIRHKCKRCGGHKVVRGENELDLYVEKGMPEGFELVFPREAEAQPDVTPGRLVFHLSSQPHPRFVRAGDDLHYKATISLLEALTGSVLKIKHLDGHIVTVTREGVTKPGHTEVVAGEGMPIYQRGDHGNLFVEYTVRFPDTITDEQGKGFRDLLESA